MNEKTFSTKTNILFKKSVKLSGNGHIYFLQFAYGCLCSPTIDNNLNKNRQLTYEVLEEQLIKMEKN